DRDACAPDLADGALVVGVVAELGRQVEGDGEPVLPPLEQVAEARVRLLGRGEARVLADRPGPAAVHVRVGTARVRELARQLELGDEPEGLLYAVNREYADAGRELTDGDEVALIPPVSGGAFRITEEPLSLDVVVDEVSDESAGAVATFLGTVRRESRGRKVL